MRLLLNQDWNIKIIIAFLFITFIYSSFATAQENHWEESVSKKDYETFSKNSHGAILINHVPISHGHLMGDKNRWVLVLTGHKNLPPAFAGIVQIENVIVNVHYKRISKRPPMFLADMQFDKQQDKAIPFAKKLLSSSILEFHSSNGLDEVFLLNGWLDLVSRFKLKRILLTPLEKNPTHKQVNSRLSEKTCALQNLLFSDAIQLRKKGVEINSAEKSLKNNTYSDMLKKVLSANLERKIIKAAYSLEKQIIESRLSEAMPWMLYKKCVNDTMRELGKQK